MDDHSFCLIVKGPNDFWECWDFHNHRVAEKCFGNFLEQKHSEGNPINYIRLEEIWERDCRVVREENF